MSFTGSLSLHAHWFTLSFTLSTSPYLSVVSILSFLSFHPSHIHSSPYGSSSHVPTTISPFPYSLSHSITLICTLRFPPFNYILLKRYLSLLHSSSFIYLPFSLSSALFLLFPMFLSTFLSISCLFFLYYFHRPSLYLPLFYSISLPSKHTHTHTHTILAH